MKSKAIIGSISAKHRFRLGAARLLAAVALALSLFLLYGSLAGNALPGCGVESGCGTVLGSRWSKWFGLPVSLPAALLYIAIIAGITRIIQDPPPAPRRLAWSFLVTAAAALIGAALWFIALQLFVIKAICPFCMTAHACGLLIGVLLLAQAPWHGKNSSLQDRSSQQPVLQNGLMLALAGISGAAVLALGQVLHQPQSYDVQAMPADTIKASVIQSNSTTPVPSRESVSSKPAKAAPVAETEKPKPSRIVGLHGDLFQLNLGELPVMGSPDAPCVIVHFFDYSCSHCRILHPILLKAVRELSNQLAIVSLHLPLATNCNRMIKTPLRDHTNACAYAMDGLVLWRANPAKFHEFEDWIFTPPRPPAPAETRAEAIRLAGSNEFARALSDPWITNRLEQNIRIFETNYARSKRSGLPQLMIGTNIVTGNFRTVEDLYKLLAAQFPIVLPVKTNLASGTASATNAAVKNSITNAP